MSYDSPVRHGDYTVMWIGSRLPMTRQPASDFEVLRVMACSIKGNVKRNTSPTTGMGGDFLDFQPQCAERHGLRWYGPHLFAFRHGFPRRDDANRFAKLGKRSGCTVSTMVLSEAHGLRLFRVIREGIGLSQRLGAGGTMPTGHPHTHPRTRASRRTGWPSSRKSA